MLRKLRILFSVLIFLAVSFFILDFAEILPPQFHVLEHIQLIPALLGIQVGIVVLLLIMSLVLGRVYCSSVCPLGVFQDIVIRLQKFFHSGKKRKRFRYLKPLSWLRWTFVAVTFIAFLSGCSFLLGLLDPYSIYARITVHLFRPAYQAGNNLLEWIFSSFGNHIFYRVSVYVMSVSSLIITLIMLAIVSIMAWKNGRIYCNTICPVGTTLGLFSRFAIFRIRFDETKCTLCGNCTRHCKASCIDFRVHKVDTSRCINCFNCIESCSEKGILYTYKTTKKKSSGEKKKLQTDTARRRLFLKTLGTTLFASGAVLANKLPGSGKGLITNIKNHPVMPPGALDYNKFSRQCTSCHLCISKCPSQVIRPAFLEYGVAGMMQPMLDYQDKFCNYECTVCSSVCPSGALSPLTKEEKEMSQIGIVKLYIHNCIVYTDETNCGACSEHCPTQAVSMKPYKKSLTIPHINQAICVGCGGCESICPAKPNKAIFVEGLSKHGRVEIIQEKAKKIEIEDFGF